MTGPSREVPEIMTSRESDEVARAISDDYRKKRQKRRMRDLTAEKNVMVADGEGDAQWAEIVRGSAVIVPPRPGNSIRFSRNLLRPITSNFVSYFTSVPLRVVATSPPGRKSRDRARIDTIYANHVIQHQNLNNLMSEALFVASAFGSCPLHINWRDNIYGRLGYDPIINPEGEEVEDGYVDIWVGDPWSTVYDDNATRTSIRSTIFERTLPVDHVNRIFGVNVQGGDDLASTSRFQRIVRRWEQSGLLYGQSGTAALQNHGRNEESVAVLVREVEPGGPLYPEGRLQMVAMDGVSHLDDYGRSGGTPKLLYDGPLPGGITSVVPLYSLNRYDDPYGKPYLSDLVPLQQQLNQIASLRAERIKRYSRPQMMAMSNSLEDDTALNDPNSILYYIGEKPDWLSPPNGNPDYDAMIQETEAQLFRIAGWQAASRGEAYAGDAASKVVALSKADDSIFGPIARDYEQTIQRVLEKAHTLFREFASTPVLAQITGEHFSYATDSWIRPDKLSPKPPKYQVTSGFGNTPENMAVTLQNLVGMAGADGKPILTTEEFWDRYPDPSMRPNRPSPQSIRRLRLNSINNYIEGVCYQAEEEFAEELKQGGQQLVMQLVQIISQQISQRFPVLRTDDYPMCIEALDEIVQDPNISPVCRMVAESRQNEYFELQQMMMQGGPPPQQAGGGGAQQQASPSRAGAAGLPATAGQQDGPSGATTMDEQLPNFQDAAAQQA